MTSFLPGRIAWRYLRAKKSHKAVSAIAAVSVAGVAIATAAVVCVLSVFNGFREVLADKLDTLSPDIIVTPAAGKVFADADSLASRIGSIPGVEIATPTLTDKALAIYNTHELPITLKGIEVNDYRRVTAIDSILIEGSRQVKSRPEAPEFEYYEDYENYMNQLPMPQAVASIGAAIRLGNVPLDDKILIFTPKREGRINTANPMGSFFVDSVAMAGVYQAGQSDFDKDLILVPIEVARDLLQYTSEASAIEIKTLPTVSQKELASIIGNTLGKDYVVKDRMQQQETNFRMVNIEKWITFLLLFFILTIASFNIVTTLCMLVIEKRRSMAILNALGMSAPKVASVFMWESIWVSLTGASIGIILGIFLCLMQQNFGLLHLNGDPSTLIMQAYPVKLIWSDIILILIPVMVIAAVTAFISARFAKSRLVANPARA